MVDKRNADFHDLSKRLDFDIAPGQNAGLSPIFGQAPASPVGEKVGIYEADALFWLVSILINVNMNLS
jgi:inositol polyphosphate 5-phosphatase INPP5B/F